MHISACTAPIEHHQHVYDFGSYRLYAGDGLRHEGKSIRLAPKELAVLQALVQRQGRLATKDEILTEVWIDDSVSDESLTRCIYVLRQVLREGLNNPIVTVHRRGYRFVAPVTHTVIPRAAHTVFERSCGSPVGPPSIEGRSQTRPAAAGTLQPTISICEDSPWIVLGYAVALTSCAPYVDAPLVFPHTTSAWIHGVME